MHGRFIGFALLAAVVSFAAPEVTNAQCPAANDLWYTTGFSVCPFQFQPPYIISWNASTSVPQPVYEIVLATYPGYCALLAAKSNWAFNVVGTTTSTSFQINLPPNVFWVSGVRIQGCPDSVIACSSDSFQVPPGKPTITSATAGQNQVTLQFTIPDDLAPTTVERAGADGVFRRVTNNAVDPCPPGTVGTFTDYGTGAFRNVPPGTLPPGTYQYRLSRINNAYFSTGPNFDRSKLVYSDPVTVVVGPPTVASFTAIPPSVRAGQPVTLSWVTQGATSVTIDNGIGAQPVSGSITVTPASTTTYTLTAVNGSTTTTATVSVDVIAVPVVAVSSLPTPMVQNSDTAGGTTSYVLTNTGGAATTITLSQNGTFFTQSPSSFTLAPGASQTITVTGNAEPAGANEGASLPSGAGVPAGLSIPIKLVSTPPPTGTIAVKATTNRVDVSAPAGGSPTGSVSFTNSGTGTLTGVLFSDVPWIIPQSGLITIGPGQTVTVTFTIDRSQRPDASSSPLGSLTGTLALVYPGTTPGALAATPVSGISIVTVVDTVQLTVTPGTPPPPLAPGELALFVPGAGHVTGSVGTFISDISLLNPLGNAPINDMKFFFTPTTGGPQLAALPTVGSTSIALGDVVKSVFNGDGQLGTLQIRSGSASKVSVNTNIFNTSNPAGTYGTTIPTFRSDRAVTPGNRLYLTGLRQDATGHTNLFIQETAGVGATVQTDFLDPSGATLATRSDTVNSFALALVSGVVPQGAVAAILTNKSTTQSPGTFLAYATPVDQASGDNWSIVDWPHQYGYSGSDPVIIPVAGVLQGANNTFFRTDVAITNTAAITGTGTLRFYPRGGSPVDQPITLAPLHTQIISNVIGSLFNQPSGSIGYLQFTPVTGAFVLTSRTYTTPAGSVATYGTHVPTVAAASALRVGSLRAIGSLQDASVASINAARPATFRTNFGLLETTGNSVTVRVTLQYSYNAGKVTAYASAAKDYTLGPNEFRQINGITSDILGTARSSLGDLRDFEADFQVIDGTGAVIIYTSSTDNGTGDVILRME